MLANFKLRQPDLLLVTRTLLIAGVLILTGMTVSQYRGSALDYLVFTAAANGLLYFGFRKNAIFFDTFVGIFFWLGFWLKLSVRVTFMNSQFHESVGNFDGSGMAFDSGLLVSTCAFAGLISFSYIREKFLFTYPEKLSDVRQRGLQAFYSKNRAAILIAFVVLIAAVVVTNAYFGFYQRGSNTRTVLPYGLNGVYKWLLLFGMASFSAMLLKLEYFDNRKQSYLVVFLALLENFASSLSLLSRGMILNSGSLVYGFYKSLSRHQVRKGLRFRVISIGLLTFLFAGSIFAVNYVRAVNFFDIDNGANRDSLVLANAAVNSRLLLLDRWVGIEGVFAVSSYQDKGWDLWWSALQEQYSESELGFYDSKLIDSPYKNRDFKQHHFVSLPGVVAFCFYPGSYLFLFICMFAAGLFAFLIEFFVYRLGGRNLILCALFARVVASRYAHFGYVPAQSYLYVRHHVFECDPDFSRGQSSRRLVSV